MYIPKGVFAHKKGAPGQILGGLLTILLMAAKNHVLHSASEAFQSIDVETTCLKLGN